MARSVPRSATTGRFVTTRAVARNPKTTVTQTVPSRAHGSRSTITGRFINVAAAARHPSTSITEGK